MAYFSCFLNKGPLIFILCWTLQIRSKNFLMKFTEQEREGGDEEEKQKEEEEEDSERENLPNTTVKMLEYEDISVTYM